MDSINSVRHVSVICILPVIIMVLVGCSTNNADIVLSQYIETNHLFSSDTIPVIDLRDAFDADFDDIYVFNGYCSLEYLDIFIKNESKEISSSSIYENEDELMVLTKQKKIIKQYRLKHNNIVFSGMDTIIKRTTFDKDTLLIYAKHTNNSVFRIQRISNKKYNLSPKN